jgi:arylsulfatase A-like enzyme
VRHLVNLSDAEIAANDRSFGALLGGLEERGLLAETLIVFLSDHGEEFQEHGGWTHGHNLNVEALDVPLIIRFPDRGQGERVGALAQHIDIAPTILDYLGLPVPRIMEGRSLLGLLDAREGRDPPPAPAFSFVDLEGRPHLAVVEGEWKLIRRLEAPLGILTTLFHRRDDPAETVNLAMEHPIRTRYLERLLDARTSAASLLTTSEAELDEETERALRALGYLQ